MGSNNIGAVGVDMAREYIILSSVQSRKTITKGNPEKPKKKKVPKT